MIEKGIEMARILNKLVSVIENRRRLIIIIAVLLIAVSLFGASRITMSTGTETFLSTDSQTYKDYERFNEHFGSSSIVVMLTGDNLEQLLQIDNLKAIESVEERMLANPGVISAIGPAFLMKQAVITMTGSNVLPANTEDVKLIILEPQSGQIRSDFSSVLPDNKHALIHVIMDGMYYTGDEVTTLIEETENAINEAGFIDVDTALTGPPAFMAQIEDMMTKNMSIMFIVSTFLMLLILALIFSVRGFFAWRWLPLGMVGLGIVYTFGATGLLSIPITMVSMSAFPILVGLGIDYSIQIHNRYDEEVRKGRTLKEAVINSLIYVGPSIGIAVVAVCLSFIAMLFSPIPMIQDFGRMLLIGVVASCIVAMVVPLSILYWRDRRIEQKIPAVIKRVTVPEEKERFIEKGLRHFASWVIKYPAVIIPIAIAISVVGLVYDPKIDTETNEANMISEDVPAMRDYQTLKDVMAGEIQLNVLGEADDVTEPLVISWMAGYEDQISAELSDNVCSADSITDIVLRTNGEQIPADKWRTNTG
jgi:hydrophobe/amphiphile efflux-3 (HAE3) family protein